MVESLVDVPSNVTVSPETGQVSLTFQLAQVLQLLSPPPPSQVCVSAKAVLVNAKNPKIPTAMVKSENFRE
jgi:hypothetical protein